ncbi:MAG TPA: formate dehydrogenase subunit gamma [Burkholderiales bacterium]|nr:formate dehydrogenase subunit gamma [Burkholderiales bacterium]
MKTFLVALSLAFAGAAAAQQAPQQNAAPTTPEQAQQQRQLTQPGNNAPVWREVQRGTPNYTSLPGREMEVLIQPPARFLGQDVSVTAGEAWRQFRNGPVTFYGGWLVVGVALIILAFYAWKGSLKLKHPPSGRLMRRFTPLEMIVHWTVAISFCVLGISGLIMLFGKHVLLPVMGYTLFSWLTMAAKNLHNFIAPLFIVSVAAMILVYVKDNFPRAYDLRWLANAWAYMARGKHVSSGRFNGGEKVWFWVGVVGLSIAVSWSGVVLLFPNFDQTRAVMQDAWAVHAIAALIYIAISLGHIYLGTIGVAGTYGNMRTGWTDEEWAREHHDIWYEEVKSGRRRPHGGPIPTGAARMRKAP